MNSTNILSQLVIVLGSAAVVTVVFQALRLPLVLGYVLAGLMIGPHVPVPLVADVHLVHVLSELGVILLMFTIGLELPLSSIARVGLPGAMTALFEVGLVIAIGTLVARLLGFDPVAAVFAGACLGISSTMLVAKAFEELGWKGGFTEVVFAILVFEDLIAIVLLAIVSAVASGAGLDALALAKLLGKLAGFLALMLIGGLLIVPRAIRWVATRARPETLTIGSLLVCFGLAALAAYAGYSVALGAFVGGVLIAESGHGHAVFAKVETLRDVFAAVFFVSVGMTIDPALLADQLIPILVFSVVVLVSKPLGVSIGAFLAGRGVLPAVRSGLSLASIGEFSFVIAGVFGAPDLLAIAVGVCCVTTMASPLFIRNSEPIANWIAHRLPKRLAMFVSFYESWLDRLRTRDKSTWRRHRRTVVVLVLDAAVLVAIIIAGATVGHDALVEAGLDERFAGPIRLAATILLALPFTISMFRRVAVLAKKLAVEVIPGGSVKKGDVDLGRAARRALVVTFELAIALGIIVPIVAVVQPFVPGTTVALLVVALILIIVMRRSIADFEGHVRASSELILELLAQPQAADAHISSQVATILPGFDGTATVAIPPGGAAIGRSLKELDLRARTGATVLAILRGDERMGTPSPSEPLREGDLLALAGSHDAITAATALLAGNATIVAP
ncbi:MAG: cation:proton antiporter [Deltaproteobacteria bacterium]|nr:cation:proton antiporter [Deltaproteobacteria bacterium]MCW5803726.1 cation:proton antiporter [Deltaproteobacteria bacterium]